MKKIFVLGVVLSVLFVAQSAFAMTFSQPVNVGNISIAIQRSIGYTITGASSNDGTRYTKAASYCKDYGYDKGMAIFGEGSDALYVHYDYEKSISSRGKDAEKFGDKNPSNAISIDVRHAGDGIMRIRTDEGITFYAIDFGYKYGTFYIIGKRKDGKWVKYIDSHVIDEKYLGKNLYWSDAPNYNGVSRQGDTIVVSYKILKSNTPGEFRFKWDEAAQWFGVEQVVY